MKHVIAHDLDLATAKKVVELAFAQYKSRFEAYHPTLGWPTDTRADIGFTAMGTKLAGTMTMVEKAIEIELDVPFLLRPFKSKALAIIEREVNVWIAKAHAGEL